MPFFLIFAAAGYDARRKKQEVSRSTNSAALLRRLRAVAILSDLPAGGQTVPAQYSVAPTSRPEL